MAFLLLWHWPWLDDLDIGTWLLDIIKMYLHTKNEVCGSGLSDFMAWIRQIDTHRLMWLNALPVEFAGDNNFVIFILCCIYLLLLYIVFECRNYCSLSMWLLSVISFSNGLFITVSLCLAFVVVNFRIHSKCVVCAECSMGYFGSQCQFRCRCLGSALCDRVTGHCSAGCPHSRWGIGCLLGKELF